MMNAGRNIVVYLTSTVFPTFVIMLLGIEVLAYWTVPQFPVESESYSAWHFDAEIGIMPLPRIRKTIKSNADRAIVTFHWYTDSRGARVSKPGDESPERPDVLVLGDSFSFGDGVENEETFAFGLAAQLGASMANLAVPSHGTTQSLQILRRNEDRAPKIVLYPFITDDLPRNISPCGRSLFPFCMESPHVIWDSNGHMLIAPPADNGLARVRLQIKSQTHGVDPITWALHGVDVIVARAKWKSALGFAADKSRQEQAFRYLLSEMLRTIKDLRSKLLVVYIPSHPDEVLRPEVARIVEQLRPISESQLSFLDLTDAFRAHHETANRAPLFIPGHGHPTAHGHALIADKIVSFLRHNQLLNL